MTETDKRRIFRIMISAAVVGIVVVVFSFLPLKVPDRIEEKPSWNVVYADVSSWAERVNSGDNDCPLPETRDTSCVGVRGRTGCDRTRTFAIEVFSYLENEPSIREKIVRAAQLAIDCEIYFGSCGRSVGAVWALGGYSGGRFPHRNPTPTPTSSGCLFQDGGCGFLPPTKRVDDLMLGTRIGAPIRNRRCTPANPPRCYASDTAATNAVRRELQRLNGRAWPDQWLQHLEPGDWLTLYVGNSTPIGSHSVLFLGWQDEASGRAWILEGKAQPWEGEPAGTERVRLASVCLKSACGQNFIPIFKVTAPE